MKRIFQNKIGITLLEGIIALGLLSLAATATFGVLLSVSRKSSRSDLTEEMLWAVERAHEELLKYNGLLPIPADQQGLCGGDMDPLGDGVHTIGCLLPAICDRQRDSSFSYQVTSENMEEVLWTTYDATLADSNLIKRKRIDFEITCNGFTLTTPN